MDREERCAAKAQMVAQMQIGQSWQEAATRAGVQTNRTAAYRLLQRVLIEGAIALRDQRHGHPAKLHGPVRHVFRHWLPLDCDWRGQGAASWYGLLAPFVSSCCSHSFLLTASRVQRSAYLE